MPVLLTFSCRRAGLTVYCACWESTCEQEWISFSPSMAVVGPFYKGYRLDAWQGFVWREE